MESFTFVRASGETNAPIPVPPPMPKPAGKAPSAGSSKLDKKRPSTTKWKSKDLKYKPNILEIAPAILKMLGIKIPPYMIKDSPLINIF